MAQYIPKEPLVAEIEKLENKNYKNSNDFNLGASTYLGIFKHFLNTIEVKEIDLEKEYKDFIKCDNGRSMFETAKHFFELGLSINNPITAADRGTAEEIIINLKRVEKDYRINLAKEMEWLRNKVKKG